MHVIPQGHSFISCLLLLAHSVVNLRDVVALDDGCWSDLQFWSQLLKQCNAISVFYSDVVAMFTDAAYSGGFGGYFQGQWFAEKWSAEFSEFALGSASSALHEIYPIIVAGILWGETWSRKCINIFCDNEAVVAIINKGRSSSSTIMSLLRCLIWQSVIHNFIVSYS